MFLSIVVCTALYLCSSAHAAWQPAKGPLLTRWGKQVSLENVHREYPRPQMIRKDWLNLNGLWEYAIKPKDQGRPRDFDGQILVPFPVESALSGVMKPVGEQNRLWYRRTFESPRKWKDQRTLLHFGAVDWDTTVWVNGKQVGAHRGGYDPFTFDITEVLNDTGPNEIVLSVWDPTDAGNQPRGKQVGKPRGIWYTAVTGIWQTVWLEPAPEAHIRAIRIEPDVDGNCIWLSVDIATFYNHPSIIMWVPYNEGWGQWDTPRIVDLIKRLDPTRLVNNTSGWSDRGVGDVHDIHRYPGPATAPIEEKRAVVLGEFGGLGLPVTGHTWQDEKNWGYRSFKTRGELTAAYVTLLDNLRSLIAGGLAAAVYTQTTDVEIEVNGMMTYDRAMIKMDEKKAATANKRLYLPPPVVKTIVPTSQTQPQSWKYTTSKPGEGWPRANFDDSAWQWGTGGFGTKGTPGAVVRTEWKDSDIWLRRTFELSSTEFGLPQLSIHHDEDAEVYINGQLVAKLKGYTSSYVRVTLDEEAQKALKVGSNCIAIRCRQTTGGQYIDAGLVDVIEQQSK